jgi:phosphodiesterase/alkaline phosphatase D-like protein
MPTFAAATSSAHPATAVLDDLEAKLQDTLALLSDVEHAYAERRARIDGWHGTERQKERLLAELETLHLKDRGPLVLRLADLHYRLTRVRIFRTVH